MGRLPTTTLTLTQIGRLRGEGRTQSWKRWKRGEYGSIQKKPGQVVRVPVSAIEKATGRSYSPAEIAAAILPRKDDIRAIENRAVIERARELPDTIKNAVINLVDAVWRRYQHSAIEQAAFPASPFQDLDDGVSPEVRLIIEGRSNQWRKLRADRKNNPHIGYIAGPDRYCLGL
jgi:hypothetical protein